MKCKESLAKNNRRTKYLCLFLRSMYTYNMYIRVYTYDTNTQTHTRTQHMYIYMIPTHSIKIVPSPMRSPNV